MIYVVLIEPKTSGNVGAIARAMANFNLNKLVIINPLCAIDNEAFNRAKHAKDILKKAKITDFGFLKTIDYVVATTSVLGTDYNIPRLPVTPEQLAKKVNGKKIAILIGREGIGLTNKEILNSDFVVTIPTSKKYPAMNSSHAAAIIFYELFKECGKEKITEHIKTVTKKEKDVILGLLNQILDNMKFATKEKKETQMIVWKRVINKAMLTKREAFALLGFLRKIKSK